jgi:hypothetical protein
MVQKRLSAVTPQMSEGKLSTAVQEQIAMYVRHLDTAMTKQQYAEKASQKMQAALAHITVVPHCFEFPSAVVVRPRSFELFSSGNPSQDGGKPRQSQGQAEGLP